MTEKGHFDQFPWPRVSSWYGCG